MKTRSSLLVAGLTLCAVGAALLPGHAQDDITLDRNRLWLNAQFAFNVSARVQSASAAVPAPSLGLDGDFQAGFELAYGRVLGFIGLSETRQAAWGVSGGFTSLDINLDQTDPTTAAEAQIDALAVGMKLGPFIELPLSRRLTVGVGAGLATVDALNTFRYGNEEYREDEWLFGCYAEATLSYALNYGLGVFAGVQYEHLGESTVTGGGRKAVLDMGECFGVVVGVRGSF